MHLADPGILNIIVSTTIIFIFLFPGFYRGVEGVERWMDCEEVLTAQKKRNPPTKTVIWMCLRVKGGQIIFLEPL